MRKTNTATVWCALTAQVITNDLREDQHAHFRLNCDNQKGQMPNVNEYTFTMFCH
jgi:hypothetical protein